MSSKSQLDERRDGFGDANAMHGMALYGWVVCVCVRPDADGFLSLPWECLLFSVTCRSRVAYALHCTTLGA